MNFSAKGAIKYFLMCYVALQSWDCWKCCTSSTYLGHTRRQLEAVRQHGSHKHAGLHGQTAFKQARQEYMLQCSNKPYSSLFWSCPQRLSATLSFLIIKKKAPKPWLLIRFQNCALPMWLYRELKGVKGCIWNGETRQKRPSKQHFLLNSLLDSLVCTFL